MVSITSFAQAHEVLGTYPHTTGPIGSYTLDTMRAFMETLGNPQNSYTVVHVAGTSGKTSTSYYLAALLQAQGYKVGLTVSPYVDQINEQAQINLTVLEEPAYCAALSTYLTLVEQSGFKLSYFEVLVGFAFWQFREQNVDYAVVEVGLGGLLDTTNVIHKDNKYCVITDIGYDHLEVLGRTLPEIAFQKAGIIQQRNQAFMYQQADEIMTVVHETCEAKQATLTVVEPAAMPADLPAFQQRNLRLAQVVVESITSRPTPLSELQKAAQTIVPARMEIVTNGKSVVILDGAHNAQKMNALIASIKQTYAEESITAVVSLASNKHHDIVAVLEALHTLVDSVILTAFTAAENALRGPIDPELLTDVCRTLGFASVQTIADPVEAYNAALAQNYDVTLITGSFYLIHDIRPLVIT